MIRVDVEQCRKIAKAMKDVKFNPKTFSQQFIHEDSEKEYVLRAFLFIAAICHQTHSLIWMKKNLKGYECVNTVFQDMAKEKHRLLDYDYLSGANVDEIAAELKIWFSEDKDASTCTLDKAEERADFMKRIAEFMLAEYGGSVEKLLSIADGYVVNSGKGVYDLLDKIDIFADPQKKKSTIFVGMAEEMGWFEVKDKEHLIPPMDYHKQRLLMRMGCVVVEGEIREKLFAHEEMESDEEIRNASIEALRVMIKVTGAKYTSMDFYMWAVARSCCKVTVLCRDGECTKKPCSVTRIALGEHDKCLFEGVCLGSKDSEYLKFWQPVVDTHYY